VVGIIVVSYDVALSYDVIIIVIVFVYNIIFVYYIMLVADDMMVFYNLTGFTAIISLIDYRFTIIWFVIASAIIMPFIVT